MRSPDATLLRDVSRSFYLSLRVLPGAMRPAVSLAYLLARASDTLADTNEVPSAERISLLDGFIEEMDGGDADWRRDLSGFSTRQAHAGEKRLLERLDEAFVLLDDLPAGQQRLVRDVIAIIAGGQRLDLERFGASGGVLPDDEALLDYCHRVAGCVGVFWTRIGFETLGQRFSSSTPGALERDGELFGRGLQLVNILRDLPKDLKQGRCYLPVDDPQDLDALIKAAAQWRERAREWMGLGLSYASQLGSRRLRLSVALPAMLGEETLDLLDRADWECLERGVKINRATVRRCLWNAWWG
jgi:farnesyl-diphosphate farnesyltransferase